MKTLILLLASSLALFGQCGPNGKLIQNPFSGLWDCTGLPGGVGVTITSPNGTITVGGTATAPTLDTVATANGTCSLAAATTCSITLTGVAAKAVWSCYDNSGTNPLIPNDFVITTDTLTFNFSAPATGYCNASTGVGLTGATGATGAAGAAGPISATGGSGTELQYRAGATTLGAVTGSSVSGADVTLGGTFTVGASVLDAATSGIAAGGLISGTNLNIFTAFSGPGTSLKTFALPNASATILTSNAAVTVAQGGTGIASGNSGGIPYFSGSTSMASSAAWTVNTLMKGGGAGAAPAVTGITVDSSNNISTPGTITSGSGSGVAGTFDLTQGTLPGSFPANSASIYSPTSIATSYQWRMPAADGAGAILSSGAGTPGVLSIKAVASANTASAIVARDASGNFTAGTITASLSAPALTLSGITGVAAQCLHVDTSGVVSGTGTDCGSGAGGGASAQLDNLSAVSINSALLFQTGIDVGSTTKPLRNAYLYGQGSFGTNYFKLDGTPTSTRTITFPDLTDTLAVIGTDNAFTAIQTINKNGIAAVSTDGLVLSNTTAATSSVQQYSPRLHFIGRGWKTASTAASQSDDWIIEGEPYSSSTNPGSQLFFKRSVNGGAYVAKFNIDDAGNLVNTGTITGVGVFTMGASGDLRIRYINNAGNSKAFFDSGQSNFGWFLDNKVTTDTNLAIRAVGSQSADLLQFLASGGTTVLSKFDVAGNLTIVPQKSTTGAVYACFDTAGKLLASATACVGTI